MNNGTLKAILTAEYADALGTQRAGTRLTSDRELALRYYYGDMPDMPTIAGRSEAVSTDVSDVIEGIMPMLMDVFVSSDDVVQFVPFGKEDEKAAQQETDYVNYVYMQKNPGFVTLEAMIKDALIQKLGVVKVWWESKEEYEREEYKNLSEDEYAILKSDPNIEIVEEEELEGGIQGYARGGRPPVGEPALVGEYGPEVFVPDQSGTIVPNTQLAASEPPHLKIDLTGGLTPRQIYESINGPVSDEAWIRLMDSQPSYNTGRSSHTKIKIGK